MRPILIAGVLLLATAACDRRDDPEVDPASTGVSSLAGDMVDSTADPAATPPTMPPPAVPADCEKGQGGEGCPPVDDQRVPVEPQPTQTPPKP